MFLRKVDQLAPQVVRLRQVVLLLPGKLFVSHFKLFVILPLELLDAVPVLFVLLSHLFILVVAFVVVTILSLLLLSVPLEFALNRVFLELGNDLILLIDFAVMPLILSV